MATVQMGELQDLYGPELLDAAEFQGAKMTFKPFSKVLLEASFSRMYQHTQNRNIGMISASRGDLPAEDNNKRHLQLKDDIRKAGYGLVNLKGRYIENFGTKKAQNVDEKALLVISKDGDDHGQLLGHLKHLGAKYGQDSILHKPHNSTTATLHGTNKTGFPGKGNTHDVGPWHPNRAGEFHSLMKGKPFAFEDFYFTEELGFFRRKETLF